MFEPNDKVTGIISGKYLGVVEFVSRDKNEVWIRAVGGCLISMSPMMLSKVPERTDAGNSRVWVGS